MYQLEIDNKMAGTAHDQYILEVKMSNDEKVYSIFYQRFFGVFDPSEVRIEHMNFTHRYVAKMRTNAGIEEVFRLMQSEVWEPDKYEARNLLHLTHTSMSPGDVAWEMSSYLTSSYFWVCDHVGFILLPRHKRMALDSHLWLAFDRLGNMAITDNFNNLPPDPVSTEVFTRLPMSDLEYLTRCIERRMQVEVNINVS